MAPAHGHRACTLSKSSILTGLNEDFRATSTTQKAIVLLSPKQKNRKLQKGSVKGFILDNKKIKVLNVINNV